LIHANVEFIIGFSQVQLIPILSMFGCQDAAKKALLLAKSFAPNAEAKWGQEGLESILKDNSIHAVAVVLPAQYQVGQKSRLLYYLSAF
jgi:hypothetical protein